jgi:hypothetical protein
MRPHKPQIQHCFFLIDDKITHKKKAAENIRRSMGVSGSFSGSFGQKPRFMGVLAIFMGVFGSFMGVKPSEPCQHCDSPDSDGHAQAPSRQSTYQTASRSNP